MVCVLDVEPAHLSGLLEFNLSALLFHKEGEAGFPHRVNAKPRHVGRGREPALAAVIHPVSIPEPGLVHPQPLGQNVHLPHENLHRISRLPADPQQCHPHVMSQGFGRGVVRPEEGRVERVADRDLIARTESHRIRTSQGDDRLRNQRNRPQVRLGRLRPVKHHQGSGDLGETGHRLALQCILSKENPAGIRFNHKKSLLGRGGHQGQDRQKRKKQAGKGTK